MQAITWQAIYIGAGFPNPPLALWHYDMVHSCALSSSGDVMTPSPGFTGGWIWTYASKPWLGMAPGYTVEFPLLCRLPAVVRVISLGTAENNQ